MARKRDHHLRLLIHWEHTQGRDCYERRLGASAEKGIFPTNVNATLVIEWLSRVAVMLAIPSILHVEVSVSVLA